MIPSETVDLILSTAKVEEVVGDFITLKRAGSSFVACCPFHSEKTPSFHVTPSRGIYKCFGCGKGGTAVRFIMEMEHCTYPEALRYLAKKYNIHIEEREESAEDIARRQHRESLMQTMEFAQKFFTSQLQEQEGRALGYAYLKERRIEDETISRFGLGWAPSGRTTLIDAALAAGYKKEYLIEAGLALEHENGDCTDKFRARVMFPIHSVSGRVIAYTGRTLRTEGGGPKYMNSAETPLYHKSDNLLGIYFAKGPIGQQRNCILVEGNVDMVMMHQLGVGNVVATCGTALTPSQVNLIKRFALENVTIMYDGDKAGINAALKGIHLFLKEDLNVKIVLLPDGEDPDDFCKKHTLEEVQGFIRDNSRDFIEFMCDVRLEQAGGDPSKKASLINEIADTIAWIPDAVKRSVYIELCSRKFGKDEAIISRRVAATMRLRLEDAAKERERNERYAQNGLPPLPQEPQVQEELPQIEEEPPVPTNPILDPAEKDLLFFLYSHGSEVLKFPTDSRYYDSEGERTVAMFIKDMMDEDSSEFQNPLYLRAYDWYFEKYLAGQTQEAIVRSALNSEDSALSSLVYSMVTDRYELTVQAFKDALSATDSWLVNFVPKAMMNYIECVLKSQIEDIRQEMRQLDADSQLSRMKDLITLQNTLKQFKKNYE